MAGSCPVYVSHSGSDSVGMRFALLLKERIHRSALYCLADSADNARFRLAVLSVDLATPSQGAGLHSAIAINYLVVKRPPELDGYLMTGLQHAGNEVVESCAEDALAELEEAIEAFGLRDLCR